MKIGKNNLVFFKAINLSQNTVVGTATFNVTPLIAAKYFNKIDERFGNSLWRWSYDYPVKGKQDISNIDDPEFVALRRRRNTAVTCMYWIFFLGFFVLMNFISQVLLKIFV